jgi:small-conductance mechanosensitive channel
MFGVEPQEKWTKEEAAAFDAHAAKRLNRMLVHALWATAVFVATALATGPFLAGHSLHAHWETIGKNLLLLALVEWFWVVLRWGYVYSARQAARETRQEMGDPE